MAVRVLAETLDTIAPFVVIMLMVVFYNSKINELKENMLQLQQKVKLLEYNASQSKKTPGTLQRLSERRDRPDGG